MGYAIVNRLIGLVKKTIWQYDTDNAVKITLSNLNGLLGPDKKRS